MEREKVKHKRKIIKLYGCFYGNFSDALQSEPMTNIEYGEMATTATHTNKFHMGGRERVIGTEFKVSAEENDQMRTMCVTDGEGSTIVY